MFYERYAELCRRRGVTPSRAAIDAGLSKSTVTKWKRRPDSKPAGRALELLCRYFGMTASELLGEVDPMHPEDAQRYRMVPSDSEMKFALFGGSGEVTDEMYREVLDFAAFVSQREQKRRRMEEKAARQAAEAEEPENT